MFILVSLKDRIRILPNKFKQSIDDAIATELNDRFANKVIINVGLCITLFDILETKDSFIYQGDGSAHTVVNFRFVVFKPYIGEVIQGTLRSCSREGVSVSLGFFNDIIIPHQYLPEPKRFDEKEQLWVWEYETEDGKHDLFMEVGETIRFKVKEELFTDTLPAGPSSLNVSTPSTGTHQETVEVAQRRIPYLIRGTVAESGLGLNSWWNS